MIDFAINQVMTDLGIGFNEMKQDKNTVWTEPNIPVITPLRLCQDCRFYLQTASKDPCESCMKNTKGEAWQPK